MIQSHNYKTEAAFLANHTSEQIAEYDQIRLAAKVASLHNPIKDPVFHSCNNGNPCSLSMTPCYDNWDYIIVNTTHVNSNSIINVNIVNGNANILIGPDTSTYWAGCCGQNNPADQDCTWNSVSGVKYGGTCKDQPYTVVMTWNNNYVESELDVFIFNDGIGPGPN